MTADMVPVAVARPRRRPHFRHTHHHRPEGMRAHAHADTLSHLGRSVPYTPHLPRQDDIADASPSPPPAGNDNDTPAPSVADVAPSPSEAVNVDSPPSEQTSSQTERQTTEWTDEAAPTPPQTQDNSGASNEDTGPQSPTPTWTPEPQPTEQLWTADPTPSTDPAPQWTPSSEPAPAPETTDTFWNTPAPQSETVMVSELAPSTSQEWAPAPTQETLAQWSETSIAPAAESTAPAEAPSSSDIVAGVIGALSSSSSVLANASTVAVAGLATSRASIAAASGTTLTPKSQPTSPGVTTSSPRAVSVSANASNPAEAASAGAENESLSTGAKAGIAIGVIAAVGAALFLILFCVRRRKRSNNIVASTDRSNPYVFGGYGAAQEKGASDLRRNGTQHSALDFSDGPLPQQRSRWRHLSTLAVPFTKDGRTRSVGPGMAGVGSSPSRLDSANPSFDHTRGVYPYARSDSDDDHNEVLQSVDDDASRFRNTHYDEWLAYDRAGVFDASAPGSPKSPSGASPKLRQPQARRVPVPSLDPDPFADAAQADAQAPIRTPLSRTRTLDNMYGIYDADEPVVQHLPYRVTPPPVQAQQLAQPQSAMLGHAV